MWRERRRFSEPEAWLDLLMEANYEDREVMWRGKRVSVKRGQVLVSQRDKARQWRWSRSKVTAFFSDLEKATWLSHLKGHLGRGGFTILTILNYGVCPWSPDQGEDREVGHLPGHSIRPLEGHLKGHSFPPGVSHPEDNPNPGKDGGSATSGPPPLSHHPRTGSGHLPGHTPNNQSRGRARKPKAQGDDGVGVPPPDPRLPPAGPARSQRRRPASREEEGKGRALQNAHATGEAGTVVKMTRYRLQVLGELTAAMLAKSLAEAAAAPGTDALGDTARACPDVRVSEGQPSPQDGQERVV